MTPARTVSPKAPLEGDKAAADAVASVCTAFEAWSDVREDAAAAVLSVETRVVTRAPWAAEVSPPALSGGDALRRADSAAVCVTTKGGDAMYDVDTF